MAFSTKDASASVKVACRTRSGSLFAVLLASTHSCRRDIIKLCPSCNRFDPSAALRLAKSVASSLSLPSSSTVGGSVQTSAAPAKPTLVTSNRRLGMDADDDLCIRREAWNHARCMLDGVVAEIPIECLQCLLCRCGILMSSWAAQTTFLRLDGQREAYRREVQYEGLDHAV